MRQPRPAGKGVIRTEGRRRPGRPVLHSVPDHAPAGQPGVHLGQQLRAARTAKGLTMEKAAAAAGLTRTTIGNLEGARFPDPKLSTLLRLMRAYDLRSLEELLGPVPSARLAAAWDEEEGWENARDAGGQGEG
jgi:DNA-binding XRE family transcriptional regulator